MKTSNRVCGVFAACMIALPAICAPWMTPRTLGFIATVEQRAPAPLPRPTGPGSLVDEAFWSAVSAAINDRLPLYPRAVGWKRTIDTRILGKGILGEVGIGRNGWLYYMPSLGSMAGTTQEARHAIETADRFAQTLPGDARVLFVAAPDKHSIYPEHLTPQLRRAVEPWLGSRSMIRAWFDGAGRLERVDAWREFMVAKSAGDLLYDPQDTHHSPLGSMILARCIVRAIDPALWDDSDIVDRGPSPARTGLLNMAGLKGAAGTRPLFAIQRPGVAAQAVWVDGVAQPNPGAAASDPQPLESTVRYRFSSDTAPLAPGRTLFVCDSFVAQALRPGVAQYFEDVTFVHWSRVAPGDLRDATEDFDLIIVQTAERAARIRFSVLLRDAQAGNRHALLRLSEPAGPATP